MNEKYSREIASGVRVDVYDVLDAFGVTNPAISHAAKKLLIPGQRTDGKPVIQELEEAIVATQRAIELERKKES